jgi:hypothetical protein
MKTIRGMVLAICVGALLVGCGDIEWFPEPKPTTPAAESRVKVTEVGTYVSSYRSGANNYTVTTTRGPSPPIPRWPLR